MFGGPVEIGGHD